MLPYLFEVDNHVLPNFTSVKEPLNYIKLFTLFINVLSKLNPQMNYGLYTASILLVSNSICNQGFGKKISRGRRACNFLNIVDTLALLLLYQLSLC
jgi:hypothetical protein